MDKDVVGYRGLYMVNDCGIVSNAKGVALITTTKSDGYQYVKLYKNGKQKLAYIHRLVAQAFLPSIDGANHINHKDHNKANNNVANLEFVTQADNNRYSAMLRRHPNNQSVGGGYAGVRWLYKTKRGGFIVNITTLKIRKDFKYFEQAKQFRDSCLRVAGWA